MSAKLLYVSFDVVPSPKGAAVHIEQFARILAQRFGALQLVTVAGSAQEDGQKQSVQQPLAAGINRIELPAPGDNLLDRVVNFRRFLEFWLKERKFDIVHFRSPFEGYVLARQKGKQIERLVFEVNGLPSIELKYRYPEVAHDDVLLDKLIGQEQVCLDAADLVITPSSITATHLQERGVSAERIKVIPNAVDLELFSATPLPALLDGEPLRLIYFGTLSAWQGVEQAVTAAKYLSENMPVHLTIVAAGKQAQVTALKNLLAELTATEIVTLLPPCSQTELIAHIHNSHIVLAPLSANDRNLSQGCCPFKILEGMASGRPVLSTALPAVLEIAGNRDETVFVCKPGSAGSMKEVLIEMRNNPERIQLAAQKARKRIEDNFNLDHTGKLLGDLYDELLSNRCISASR